MGEAYLSYLMIAFYLAFLIISLVQTFLCTQFIITRPLFRPPFVLLLVGSVILLARWSTQVGLFVAAIVGGQSESSIYEALARITLADGILAAIADALICSSPFALVYYCTVTPGSSEGHIQMKTKKKMMIAALVAVGLVCVTNIAYGAILYIYVKRRVAEPSLANATFPEENVAVVALRETVIALRIAMLALLVGAIWPNRGHPSGRLVLLSVVPALILQEFVIVIDMGIRYAHPELAELQGYNVAYQVLSNFVDPILVGVTLRIGARSIVNPRLLPAPKNEKLTRPTESGRSSIEDSLIDVDSKC